MPADLQHNTFRYWLNWLNKCKYRGRWREHVERSALTLKLLTYEPTGALVAAATFSLPEDFGGSRNWDYRYSWVRDSAFTIYAFIRLGFTEEADNFMKFIMKVMDERLECANRKQDTGFDLLPIMLKSIFIHLMFVGTVFMGRPIWRSSN
jgi:GH15 family glucan-1,4-alpha-glucosidase